MLLIKFYLDKIHLGTFRMKSLLTVPFQAMPDLHLKILRLVQFSTNGITLIR